MIEIEKYISSDVILRRLKSEFGFNISKFLDIRESIGDAVRELGYGVGFKVEYERAVVSSFKFEYPCDMIALNKVYYKGQVIPLSTACSRTSYYEDYQNPAIGLESDIINKIKAIQSADLQNALESQTPEQLSARNELVIDVIKSFDDTQYYSTNSKLKTSDVYWITPTTSLIKTNLPDDATVTIEYVTIARDSNNVPLLLDEINYINAILYYCAFILIQSGQEHPVISYRDIIHLKEKHMNIARNERLVMTYAQMERFVEVWTNPTLGGDYFHF